MTIGFCQCGCGTPTKISPKSNTAKGWVAGQPRTWAKGHHTRQSPVEYIVDENGCWIWQLGKDRDGYGLKWTPDGTRGAHRVYFDRDRGPIPDGLTVDHLCQVRACVNPAHMEPVTSEENSARRGRTPVFVGGNG